MSGLKDFPWGKVVSWYNVGEYRIIKYHPNKRIKGTPVVSKVPHKKKVRYHVVDQNVSFKREGEALIYIGLIKEGVNINTASRLAWGLIDGFGA